MFNSKKKYILFLRIQTNVFYTRKATLRSETHKNSTHCTILMGSGVLTGNELHNVSKICSVDKFWSRLLFITLCFVRCIATACRVWNILKATGDKKYFNKKYIYRKYIFDDIIVSQKLGIINYYSDQNFFSYFLN